MADKNIPRKMDIIQQILMESKSYSSVEMMESLVESEGKELASLATLPIQPLYMALKKMSPEQLAPHLSKFSKEQRTRFLDLDLWIKDDLDVESFNFWVKTYTQSNDLELIQEFSQSSEFNLYLKGVFNIWTFDIEDPQYPDHDNYFLTDDNLLLFEFNEGYEYIDEVRQIIRGLYGSLGVENAYTFLFKMVSDSFSIMQEEEYQSKNYRLAEIGFVDYFTALKMDSNFASKEVMDHYITNYDKETPVIEGITVGQTLHNASLTAFKGSESFREELEKVVDPKRREFLHFNFTRLVNGTLTLENAFKSGTLAMTRVGEKTCSLLELGYAYIRSLVRIQESLFEKFDFNDLYRVGNSLISFKQKELTKALRENGFEESNSFLGKNWSEFLDYSFEKPVKYVAPESELTKPQAINTLEVLYKWEDRLQQLISVLPFAHKLSLSFDELKKESKIQDSFYLNYSVDEIDFIAIIISSFANFALNNYERSKQNNKIGLTIDEFKKFVSGVLNQEGKVDPESEYGKMIEVFVSNYGLEDVYKIRESMLEMLLDQLEGYDYMNLKEDDFQHVGGPIILNTHLKD